MWGREMRAGLVFVLVSLLAGAGFREWKRSHRVRFAELIETLESGEMALPPARPDAKADEGSEPRPSDADASTTDRSPRRRARANTPALEPGRLELDRASAADLERLPGIGPALAARIVADRERHGPFGRPEALLRVSGIGPRILARIRPYLAETTAPDDSLSPNAN